jgi:hypothetical protein
MTICFNCQDEYFSWENDIGTIYQMFCSEKCAKEHEKVLETQDWPRDSALKYKVPVGEIACPHCGTVQHGTLHPICAFCDKPYWKIEDFDIKNAPWLHDIKEKI